ncbi:hypothetical protein MCOR29_005070 [Pyricularia oryzae]|uniref:Dockerin type 1 n=1 Tax=Pyricularia grisea TaxID=148305 RepID=A0ABQ8NVV4_PYRGI|nr:hypothetical protein MCOR01_002957 [Pyricularia oryzae]KAI6302895.1 hypothetical protein MCOR33_001804 [Pyricularia grisea]KAI6288458.1 hypothetical protein MCOR26_000060 [Pyricularia oryzae]KAI6313525.1 hypothetical protein MCOR30_010269 [Pyricularia oryzae]KAI6321297.1 hypothetical protein MCOR29_005070 [Pyricularia oryzae]
MSSPETTTLADPVVTVLGRDPPRRKCLLNGAAFQQDAVVSLAGWQYAVFYSPLPGSEEPVFVHVARRKLPASAWEVLVLQDYPQTVDDGHNTVQMGICVGDGTIHLSYDHHCDVLRYRQSVQGLAINPERFTWNAELFTPTLDHLPGLPNTHEHFGYVTYPRFINSGRGQDMLMSFRTGKAGLGDDHLYVYRAAVARFELVGTHLVGVQSNPYVHGMDVDAQSGRLHVTWVYRGFVHYEGWDDPLDTKHKQQAGPNGAENNHNLCYAYSDDCGRTWRNTHDQTVADLGSDKAAGVRPDAVGLVVFEIPKGSGLTNQESQVVDPDGGVHVLNRTCSPGSSKAEWRHFYREHEKGIMLPLAPTVTSLTDQFTLSGQWQQSSIGITADGRRGRLAVSQSGDLFIILPDSNVLGLTILRALKTNGYAEYQRIWQGDGLSGEPLVDIRRLNEGDGVLSVFTRRVRDDKKEVVVLDFELP